MVLKYNVPPWRAFVVFIMSYLQGFMAYGTIVLAAPFYVLYLGDRGEYGAGDFSDPDFDMGIAIRVRVKVTRQNSDSSPSFQEYLGI
jgi:hypothetical protein